MWEIAREWGAEREENGEAETAAETKEERREEAEEEKAEPTRRTETGMGTERERRAEVGLEG